MKKIYQSIGLACIILVSCTAEDPGSSNAIVGKWRWESTCGGVAGCVYETPQDQATLKISKTHVDLTRNGVNDVSSDYQLIETSFQDGSTHYQIKFTNQDIWNVQVKKNDLWIVSDIVGSNYKRVR